MADTLRDVNAISMYRMGREVHTKSNSTSGGEYFAQSQGMCRVGSNIVYACIPTTGNTSNVMLRAINPVTGNVVKSSKVFDLGHCNSMTYDTGNDMIYACRMLDGTANSKKLERIKYSTFTKQTAVTLDDPFYACAFDDGSKKLYTLSSEGSYIDVYSQNGASFTYAGEIVFSLPREFFSWTSGDQNPVAQSFEFDGAYFYLLYAYPNMILVYDLKGSNVQNYSLPARTQGLYPTGECEDLTHMGDGKFYITSNTWANTHVDQPNMTGVFTISLHKNLPNTAKVSVMDNLTYGDQFTFHVDNSTARYKANGSAAYPFYFIEEAIDLTRSQTVPGAVVELHNTNYPALRMSAVDKPVIIKGPDSRAVLNGAYITQCDKVYLSNLRFSNVWRADYKCLLGIEHADVVIDNCTFASQSGWYDIAAYRSNLSVCESSPGRIYASHASKIYLPSGSQPTVNKDSSSKVFN